MGDCGGARARNETIEVLLAEAEKSLERQLDTVDGLDAKGGRLVQAVTVGTMLLTLATALVSERADGAPLWGYGVVVALVFVALLLYAATWLCIIRAFRLRTYYLPMKMDREDVRIVYLGLTRPEAQDQLLANYIEASQKNWGLVDDKAKWISGAAYLAVADVLLLAVAVAVGVLLRLA